MIEPEVRANARACGNAQGVLLGAQHDFKLD